MTTRPAARSPDPDREGFELEADLVRVLAHPKRLMIVDLLGRGPATVTGIADRLELSLQNTSQHLRVMRDRGLVRAHRDGREVCYALVSPVLAESCRLVRRALLANLHAPSVGFDWSQESRAGDRAVRSGALGPARRPTTVEA
jgi:DNA-binding transcriptional ArsR family regulator